MQNFWYASFSVSCVCWQTDEAKKKLTTVVKLFSGLIDLFLKILEIFILQSRSGHLNSSELLNFSLATSLSKS